MVKTAFLFPGQGSQTIGMGKTAAEKSPRANEIIQKADAFLGYSLSQVMFEGPEEKLKETDITQPALFVASAAALELLKEKGISPSWVAGHSLGEYSALYAAGVLSFETALRLVQERGKAMSQAAKASSGAMAAIIGLDFIKIKSLCEEASTSGICSPANFNSESQIVISGSTDAVKKAMDLMTAAGAAKAVLLNVAGAFHSPLMSPAVNIMKPLIEQAPFSDAKIPVLTNVDARITTKAVEFKKKITEQIDHAVLWDPSMKELIHLGAETFIEVGSGRVLGTMAKKLDRKKSVFFTDDLESLDKVLAPTPQH